MNRAFSALCTLALASAAAAQSGFTQTDTALKWAAGVLDMESNYRKVFANTSTGEAKRLFGPVLQKESSRSSGYFVASLFLACKGVDLKDNTRRVLKPALIWKENSTREFKVSNGLAEDAVMLEDVPRALYLIVKTQRYQPALKALITMPSDGAVAENQDDMIMDLLNEEPITVMRLATAERPIYDKLIDTIDWNVGPPAARKAFLAKLGAVRWPDSKLKRTATSLIRALKTPIHRNY